MARPRTSVLLELHVAGQIATELVARELERDGFKVGAHALLLLIAGKGPLTPTELTLATGLRSSTVRERLQPLYDGELIERRASELDRRSHTLEVTARGLELIEQARPLVAAADRALEAQLDVAVEDLRPHVARLTRAGRAALAKEPPLN